MSEGSTSCTESAYVFDLQDWETWQMLPIDVLVTTHSFFLSNNIGGGGDELIIMHCQLEG